MTNGVVLRGSSQVDRPIVDAQGLGTAITVTLCDTATRLEDLEIVNGFGAGFGGGLSLLASPIGVHRCRFVGNVSFQGGAVGGDDSAFSLTSCEFVGNSATQTGGAIAITDLPSPTISGCRFTDNSALAGGAIAVRNGCVPAISLCIMEANDANQGAAIWYDFFSAGSVTGCTIVFNTALAASGGSLFFSGFSAPILTSNIVAFGASGGAAFVSGGANPIFGCNDVFANTGGNTFVGAVDLGTNFSDDPLFCDGPGGDYSLQPNSPCLSAPNCGPVGALGIGSCGAVPVNVTLETTTWGSLKAMYR